MKLYGYYRSSTSYRLRIALNLKKVEYTQIPVNLKTGEQKEDAYGQVNPYRTVPALETEQGVLYQSLAQISWLDDTYPDPSFLPEDRESRQLCRELYYAVASEIHAINNLPVLNYLRSEFAANREAIESWYATWIHRTLKPVEERLKAYEWLSDTLPFGKPTLFEIVLIPQIYNARRWNVSLSPYPLLESIDAACAGIEAFEKAHPAKQDDAEE